jgi:hypothetical protein
LQETNPTFLSKYLSHFLPYSEFYEEIVELGARLVEMYGSNGKLYEYEIREYVQNDFRDYLAATAEEYENDESILEDEPYSENEDDDLPF